MIIGMVTIDQKKNIKLKPTENIEKKIEGNIQRDKRVTKELKEIG